MVAEANIVSVVKSFDTAWETNAAPLKNAFGASDDQNDYRRPSCHHLFRLLLPLVRHDLGLDCDDPTDSYDPDCLYYCHGN